MLTAHRVLTLKLELFLLLKPRRQSVVREMFFHVQQPAAHEHQLVLREPDVEATKHDVILLPPPSGQFHATKLLVFYTSPKKEPEEMRLNRGRVSSLRFTVNKQTAKCPWWIPGGLFLAPTPRN